MSDDTRLPYEECLLKNLKEVTAEEIEKFARDKDVLEMAKKYSSGESFEYFFLYVFSENNVEYKATSKD